MKHAALFRAAYPDPHTVLGLELRDLSLGHLFLLHRLESPFVGCGDKVTYEDLACAVFVCSRSYDEAREGLRADNLGEFMEHWARLLTRSHGILFHLGIRKPVKIDLEEKAKAFQAYITEGMKCPTYSVTSDAADGNNIDALQSIKIALLMKTNLTFDQVMNQPFALSMWDFFTVASAEGSAVVYDEEEMKSIQEMGPSIIENLKARGLFNG